MTDEIKKGFDILKKLGIMEVVLSGGNPLLREDAGEIIKYASERFVTTLYDNGSMAGSRTDILRDLDFVAISIDSLNPDVNDRIKGVKGAWKKAIDTVETLHNEGINVAVTPTISQQNLYEIADITKHFLQKGIPLWYCLYSYDITADVNQLFKIGKANDAFVITDKQAMVKLCNTLLDMKKTNDKILMTDKLLKTLRDYYLLGQRTWGCRALQNFFMIDHLGRIAGCHGHNIAGSIFDLPKLWRSQEFNQLRSTYRKCTQCTYLCYIFYSIHGSPYGNLSLAKEQWKNAGLLLKKSKPRHPELSKLQGETVKATIS